MNREKDTEPRSESAHKQRLRQQISGVLDPENSDGRLYVVEAADKLFDEKNTIKKQLNNVTNQLNEIQIQLSETENAVYIDKLTGCFNRNYWEDYVNNNNEPMRDNDQLIVFSADVNNLKLTNDLYGYEAGDLLIQYAAGLLRRLFPRSDDKIIRIGGDEFVVLCHNHNAKENDYQKILNTINERLKLNWENPNTPNIDIGIGSALFDNETDNSIEDTKIKADNAMKLNKLLVKNNNSDDLPTISTSSDYELALITNPTFAALQEKN